MRIYPSSSRIGGERSRWTSHLPITGNCVHPLIEPTRSSVKLICGINPEQAHEAQAACRQNQTIMMKNCDGAELSELKPM